MLVAQLDRVLASEAEGCGFELRRAHHIRTLCPFFVIIVLKREDFTMDKQSIDLYLIANAKYFDSAVIPMLRQSLENCDENVFISLQAIELKDPTIMLLISIFVGNLGIDRFMLGDIGMGVLKLLTAGCCGILTIIDWFTVMKRTKEKNLAAISMVL